MEKPTYDSSSRKKTKLTPQIIERIEYYLQENETKRAIGRAKQQKKKIDIYEALIEEGFDISYPTICNTIRTMEKKNRDAFIKQHYSLGEVCEFDWGEVKLTIDGRDVTLQLAVFTSAKGNYRYARLFYNQPYLLPRLPKYDTARIAELRVDKYSTVCIDTCRYSVPDQYVGEFLFVKIADELGYISFDKEGSELLFTHLSLRAGRKSTIITTNLSFERWEEIFKDPVMTAAMIDRLTHKSYIVNMNGNSYRLKETKKWLEEQE